jgi:hypothetical protein
MRSTLMVDPGNATPRMIEEAWNAVLPELHQSDQDASGVIRAHGVNRDTLASLRFDVEEIAIDPGLFVLIVANAMVPEQFLKSLWDGAVRRLLQERFGVQGGPSQNLW